MRTVLVHGVCFLCLPIASSQLSSRTPCGRREKVCPALAEVVNCTTSRLTTIRTVNNNFASRNGYGEPVSGRLGRASGVGNVPPAPPVAWCRPKTPPTTLPSSRSFSTFLPRAASFDAPIGSRPGLRGLGVCSWFFAVPRPSSLLPGCSWFPARWLRPTPPGRRLLSPPVRSPTR